MSKKLTNESFQNLYPVPTDEFSRRMADMLQNLPAERRKTPARGKLSAGLILAFVLMLITFSAVAAELEWDVLGFLFFNQNHASKALVQYVDIHSGDGQVTLSVNSAMTDGESLVLDWTIVNEKPDMPVYMMVDEFTVNGTPIWTDGNDEFDSCWLPGPFGQEGKMQGGELIKLPEALRTADRLDVVMRANVYHPKLPVYIMDEYDEALAGAKMREGYLVVPEGEGYVAQDADGIYWAAGPNPANMKELFTAAELEIAFTLSPEAGRASVQRLQPQKQYENERFIARYTKAEVSLIGLTLYLEIEGPDAEYYSFELTDGQGNVLKRSRTYIEYETETAANGNTVMLLKGTWYGLTQDALPNVVSLTCYTDDGETVILPVQVRSF